MEKEIKFKLQQWNLIMQIVHTKACILQDTKNYLCKLNKKLNKIFKYYKNIANNC